LEGATYVYLHDGARAKDPHTPQKDIQLLLNAIQKEPSNPHNFFYLGKMYLSLGELEKALQTFKQCAEMKGFEEEIYLSKLSVAQVQNMLKKDPLTVKKSFLDAFSYRPHRAEALYGLIDKLQEEKEYEKAFQAVSLALELPRQHNDILFVEHWILDFGFLIQYAMCAAQTGRYVEGLQACKTLLAERNLSEDQKSQVNKYQGYLQELSQKELKQKLQNLISPALL
jgi:tetratricopeptide (TPR) repeat protein